SGQEVVIRWQSRDRDPVAGIDINALIVEAFEANHPGIRVEYAATTGSELAVQLIGGAAPDVIDTTGPNIRRFMEGGLLLSLSPHIDFLMPGDDRADFFELQLEAFQENGVFYAVPKY